MIRPIRQPAGGAEISALPQLGVDPVRVGDQMKALFQVMKLKTAFIGQFLEMRLQANPADPDDRRFGRQRSDLGPHGVNREDRTTTAGRKGVNQRPFHFRDTRDSSA